MTATVPMGMLGEIQGWAPAGGFVRSQWRNGAALAAGDLFRHAGRWAVITGAGWAITTNGAGEETDRSPVIAWRDMDGARGTRVLWGHDGAEVRTDTRIDPASWLEQAS